jgi:uncharacterized membrane protein
MMWLIAAFASAIVFGISGFLLKVGSHKKYQRTKVLSGLYIIGSIVFLIPLIIKQNITVDPTTLFFALIVGLGSYYGNSFLIKAYDLGPACLTSPLVNISVLLVILLSIGFYDEKLSTLQYAGVISMIGAVTLLSCNFKNTLIKSRMWIIFVTLTILFIFMREGGLKIAHEKGLNNFVILFFSYVFASVFTLISLSKDKLVSYERTILKNSNEFLLGSIMGLFSASGLMLLAYAIDHGPASIVVPIFSGRNFVVILLLFVFFKEKLSFLQWLAVGLLILGVILLA